MVLVVSRVSMCNQNERLALQPAGIATDCDSVSVRVVPCPPSSAVQVPPCAGCAVPRGGVSVRVAPCRPSSAVQVPPCAGCAVPRWAITPVVAVHPVAPDSKPALASFWPEQLPGPPVGLAVGVGDGSPPPEQVGSAGWAGTLTASQAALT